MSERACPECGATIPVTTGYADWCGDCGWNLAQPPAPWAASGRFGRLAERLGRRSGERLARELRAADELRPRLTAAKALAYALAAGVHLFTLALAGFGLAAIVVEFPNPISIAIGLAMLCVAAFMRPRVPRMPEGTVLEPTTHRPCTRSRATSRARSSAPRRTRSWPTRAGTPRGRSPAGGAGACSWWASRYWRRSSRRSGWR